MTDGQDVCKTELLGMRGDWCERWSCKARGKEVYRCGDGGHAGDFIEEAAENKDKDGGERRCQ